MGKDVIIACDFASREQVLAFLDRFTEEKPFVKIGMELFYAEGPQIVREIKAHKRIIFNGNGYAPAWVDEAEKRGLLNLRTTVDALPRMVEPKNIKLFVDHKVYSEAEILSRY